MPQLIDPETPASAKTRQGYDGYEYDLVFSDEFNTDGRSFYPGDDPFWEAVDLNYWATGDTEWYGPDMVTTENGSLVITLDSWYNHNLWYRSGMLQTWNKFCFTGGYVEVSVLFPGNQLAQGFWPAAWTMGNLGRPGYGAATDGTWPYTYDSCDVGTLPNQTNPDGSPASAAGLSWLPGQKLSACTCAGEDHPGPTTSTGRGAPEIDLFEAERSKIGGPGGQTSQSSQFAPFNDQYQYDAAYTTVYTQDQTIMNTFHGSHTQQSISALTNMDANWFEYGPNPTYATYGVEYMPDPENRPNGFINWAAGGQRVWGYTGGTVGPDANVNISQRLISEEPMALVLNLGLSKSFQSLNWPTLQFPAHLRFDYVRVYQRTGSQNIGCDPSSHPTAKYINDHMGAYTNVNYTSWQEAGYTYPKNSLVDQC